MLDLLDESLQDQEEAQGGACIFLERRVRKNFGDHGWFDGIVTSTDVADDGSGADLFFVTYEDADGEVSWSKFYKTVKQMKKRENCDSVC